jgi:hypothetical protein
MDTNFDTLIVDRPVARAPATNAPAETTMLDSAHHRNEKMPEHEHRAGMSWRYPKTLRVL